MPWWTSSRRGDENWPSHMERRRDGATKVKAKKLPVTYVHLVEEDVEEHRLHLRGGGSASGYSRGRESFCGSCSRGTSSAGSTVSSNSSSVLSPRRYQLPVPSPPVPAVVVTMDFPADSACGNIESRVGGSDTESDAHRYNSGGSSSSSSSSSNSSISTGSRRNSQSSTFEATTAYRPRSLSPISSAASITSRHSRATSIPLDLRPNASSKSSLPHPREPSPPPSPEFPRPPASPVSSVADSSTTGTAATATRRSAPSDPSVSVDIVTCEPPASIADSGYSGGYNVPAVVTAPERPIALRRTWTRPQPLPVLQPIQTDFSSYQVGYSPYVPYPTYDNGGSSVFSPTHSKRRVRRADRTPRSPWAVTRAPKTPNTPKTPKTQRLARAPRAVRMKTRKREKPRIIQAPHTPRTPHRYSAPFEPPPYLPKIITASSSVDRTRGRPSSPTGSYVRTESGSRERRRQRRAVLAARKAEASAAVMAVEAAKASRSGPGTLPPRRLPPQIVMGGSGSSGSSISSGRSRRRLTPVRVEAPQLPLPRRRKSALALSRHRTEPIRSPIVDVHHPPRTPRRQSATTGLADDPRVVRVDDPTWGDYLKGGGGTRPARAPSAPFPPSTVPRSRKTAVKNGPSLFGGYYESAAPQKPSTPSTPMARSMRPLDDILAFLRPRESGSGRDRPRPSVSPRAPASMAPRVAAARREATRRGEQLSSSTSQSRSRSRSQSRM